MYNNKEAAYSIEDIKKFIIDMIEENEFKLSEILVQKNICINDITQKEAFIHSLREAKTKNSNLFSPNSKDYSTKEYDTELEKLRIKLENIEKEEQELRRTKIQIMEIKQMLVDKKAPQLNLGINILELQEQDRQRIARDLHDSTVQSLTSIIHKCELCLRLVDMDPVRAKLELNTMSNTLKSVISEIRETIYDLKPMSLDDLGLITTVERYVNQLMISHDIDINVKHGMERLDILPIIRLAVFRMIQEACSNTIKHADAKSIDIEISYDESYISVSITDDGKGFNADKVMDYVTPDYSGYGLTIMKERVYLLAGTMNITSTINKGTTVTIKVPISKSEREV